jgi:prolyl oligopeptidase
MTTAESDSRVDPLHARKMAAPAGRQPPRTTTRSCCSGVRAGHGQGKPLHKQADELADVLSFFTWQLGVEAGT